MRSEDTLNEIDTKSINDILILFNQWVRIGKDEDVQVPADVFALPEQKEVKSLDEEVRAAAVGTPSFTYETPTNPATGMATYSPNSEDIYMSISEAANFETGELVRSQYMAKSLYKIH